MIEQCSAVILDENNVEVKCVVCFDIMVEEIKEKVSISNVKCKPFDDDTRNNAPGMVVYIPSKKESIWQIGKRYGVSQESMKEINQLTGTEVERGQKILLVKGMD